MMTKPSYSYRYVGVQNRMYITLMLHRKSVKNLIVVS